MTDKTRVPVFDGHNDTLLRLLKTGENYYERGDEGHIDDVKAREGNLVGGFFACFVPSASGDTWSADTETLLGSGLKGVDVANEWGGPSLAYAQQFTNAMIAKLLQLETGGISVRDLAREDVPDPVDDPISVVQFAEEIAENVESGVFSAIMHFEGAEMIDENLYALEMYHSAGLRSLGPVWSRSNIFAHGVPFAFGQSPDTGPGLTDLGKELVRACNALGILVDVSHLNEKGFWDIAEITAAPIVATHSNVHAICPSTRNLTDKQLDAIAESGGVVGLNFNVPFLHPEGKKDADMPLSIMADHVDYLVDKLGIDGVAMGSDFDGAMMPNGVSDCSKLPNLIDELRGRGYDDEALLKIGYKNWVRVLAETWGM
ncbi:MAG TPA: dipeptidase [Thermomicrobiales bacterium]|nr:dipeptidase [Thermomicrobiales bacterium]